MLFLDFKRLLDCLLHPISATFGSASALGTVKNRVPKNTESMSLNPWKYWSQKGQKGFPLLPGEEVFYALGSIGHVEAVQGTSFHLKSLKY